MDLIDRINANYNNLSRVHKRIVDYITDNPDRACFQSLKDFSDSVNASPVTVLRCLDKLGINGFIYAAERVSRQAPCIGPERAEQHQRYCSPRGAGGS